MPATPTLTLIDELVEVVRASWAPSGDDEVERLYDSPFTLATVKGRKVWLFPATYDSEPADRGNDQYAHRIAIVTAERFVGKNRPTKAWLDERVDFVFEKIWGGLDFSHDGPHRFGSRSIVTTGMGPVDIYDPDLLRLDKVFWSEVEAEFMEILPA